MFDGCAIRNGPQNRTERTFLGKSPIHTETGASILNFRPLRAYFEEEEVTSTTSVIHHWKALVKPEF
jgi:hypothetical protein